MANDGGSAMVNPDETRLSLALAGRYRIERELGAGGMATVYLAEDLKHKRKVAVKVLKPELAAVLGAERFVQEIRTTAALQHPHILPLFDSGEADGFLYYVMPFIDGETLRAKLDRETQVGIDESIKMVIAVADAQSRQLGTQHRPDDPRGGRALEARRREEERRDDVAIAARQLAPHDTAHQREVVRELARDGARMDEARQHVLMIDGDDRRADEAADGVGERIEVGDDDIGREGRGEPERGARVGGERARRRAGIRRDGAQPLQLPALLHEPEPGDAHDVVVMARQDLGGAPRRGAFDDMPSRAQMSDEDARAHRVTEPLAGDAVEDAH